MNHNSGHPGKGSTYDAVIAELEEATDAGNSFKMKFGCISRPGTYEANMYHCAVDSGVQYVISTGFGCIPMAYVN